MAPLCTIKIKPCVHRAFSSSPHSDQAEHSAAPNPEMQHANLSMDAVAAGSLRVLTTDTDVPVVTETTVTADLLVALEFHTETGIEGVRELLGALAILEIVVVVEEPRGHLELEGVVADGDDLIDLVGAQLTSALVDIDVTLLQHKVGKTAADTYFIFQ